MFDTGDLFIVLGGGIGFPLGQKINAALTRAERRRVAAGHPPPQARLTNVQRTRARYLGILLIAVGVLIVPAGAFGIGILQQGTKIASPAVTVSGILGGIGQCLLCVACSNLITRGRRMRALNSERRLADDPRPATVYLRPFHFDRASRADAARSEFFKSTHEQRLARAIRHVGPFVALGDPSAVLPDLGATRLYPDDPAWQQTVKDLVRSAGTIIVHVGDSPGLAWEVALVVDLGQPERIILSLVTEDRQRYDDFRDRFGHLFPRGLLADIGTSEFLYFDADWTPRAYDRRAPRHPEAAPGSRAEQRTMVLRRLGDRTRQRVITLLAVLFFGWTTVFLLLNV